MDAQKQYWVNFFSEWSTKIRFNEFCKLFEEPLDNRSLEDSDTVKYLKQLLLSDDPRIVHILPKGTELFRCRRLPHGGEKRLRAVSYDEGKKKLHGYDCYDSKEPPITVSGAGRNNIKGASYLYLAENEYTACAETRPNNFDILSVARFRIKKDIKVFDLSVDDNFKQFDDPQKLFSATRFLSLVMARFYTPVSNETEYLIPQYISDLVRKYGFDGICYIGSMSWGKCYTIFACGDNYVEFVDSELIANYAPRFDLYRLNDASNVVPHIHEKFESVTSEDIESIKSQIIEEVRRNKNG